MTDHAGAANWIDHSGAIAVGATAQPLDGANAVRRGFLDQKLSDGDLWIGIGGAAAPQPPALRIAAGALYETPIDSAPANLLSISGAATGQRFTAEEW